MISVNIGPSQNGKILLIFPLGVTYAYDTIEDALKHLHALVETELKNIPKGDTVGYAGYRDNKTTGFKYS